MDLFTKQVKLRFTTTSRGKRAQSKTGLLICLVNLLKSANLLKLLKQVVRMVWLVRVVGST